MSRVTIRQLAGRARMSERTFARRFVQETGTTPLRWLTGQRILLAQELLEETTETIDWIADRAGFGNAAALRHHFRVWRGTTPQAYRRAFSPDGVADSPDGVADSPDGFLASPDGFLARAGGVPAVPDAVPASLAAAYSSSGANTVGMAG